MEVDVVVVGLGHAGCEAALAAARMGRQVVALTQRVDRIGLMSCNPAVGGSAKSQLVRELDALGGEMAKVADATGTQFRVLNASRGAAVQATRVLCDRQAYAAEMTRRVLAQKGLEVRQASVEGLLIESGAVRGVRLDDGTELRSKAVVVTTGTFLSGVLHTGEQQVAGGRVGDAPSRGLSESFRALGLQVGRFKTGTPARLLAKSIDLTRTERQPGDPSPRPLSFWTERTHFPRLTQLDCHLTYTTPATHAVVQKNLDRSPLYQGRIVGRGPRYCPSLEDKVVRFSQRERHTVFLEPDGIGSPLVYPAGLSTSLPEEVQLDFLRTIPGLEQVEIAVPGYAVEYDYVPATQLTRSLQVGATGLFLAGQINGTSGYEEAAVQGLWAGINAARASAGQGAWSLLREEAHLAVLIDELVTKATTEPFRMFTSRSEHRLALRESNADLRLSFEGVALGLLDSQQRAQVETRRERLDAEQQRLEQTQVHPDRATLAELARLGTGPMDKPMSLRELLCRPEATWALLAQLRPPAQPLSVEDQEEIEARVKYAGYQRRNQLELNRVSSQLGWAIPRDFSYVGLSGLSREVQEKLSQARPATLGDASKISGVTPASLAVLAIHLTRKQPSRS
jgi:tRNA uridine 5-carboxymethylaminomethyl modification enzyme